MTPVVCLRNRGLVAQVLSVSALKLSRTGRMLAGVRLTMAT